MVFNERVQTILLRMMVRDFQPGNVRRSKRDIEGTEDTDTQCRVDSKANRTEGNELNGKKGKGMVERLYEGRRLNQ